MSKAEYLDMCVNLGTEPDENEMPPDFEDLTIQSQECINLFNYLPDKWNEMSGSYVGKDLSDLFTIYKLFNIDKCNWLLYLELLNVIIDERIRSVNNKIKREAQQSGKQQTNKKTFVSN